MPLSFYEEHFVVTYAPRGTLSLIVYLLMLALVGLGTLLICWYTTGFWVYNVVDCGKASAVFDGQCGLHVIFTSGIERFWTCNEGFNSDYLIGSGVFIQPFFSIFEAAGAGTDIMISIPVGSNPPDIYMNPQDAQDGVALDAVQSIDFVPGLKYTANGNLYTISKPATPQLSYRRTQPYIGSTVDNSSFTFSGGPLSAHSEYSLTYSTSTDASSGDGCVADASRLSSVMSSFTNFSSVCEPSSRMLLPVLVREEVGGLELVDASSNFGQDLGLLNSFTWRITLHFPEACMPHTPQAGYSLKYLYIQFFCIAWIFYQVFWQVRGIIATNGLIDLNAYYQRRLVGSRERIQ